MLATQINPKEAGFDVHAVGALVDAIDANIAGENANRGVPLHPINDKIWDTGVKYTVRPAVTVAHWRFLFGAESSHKLRWLDQVGIEALMEDVPVLRELVDEAYQRLMESFKGDVFTLRTSIDPDDNSLITLVLKVKTSKEYDEASSRWQQFNDEWWLPNYERSQDKLCILLDF